MWHCHLSFETEFLLVVFCCIPPCVYETSFSCLDTSVYMLGAQSVVCASADHMWSLDPREKPGVPVPVRLHWSVICSLTRSLVSLMYMKVWEALVYKNMLKSFTDEKQSSFYIFRANQMEEMSKPVISLWGGEVVGGRKGAWMMRNEQLLCFLPTPLPPSYQPPITTHAFSQLPAWIHSHIEWWSP